jgi:hypothetical protein
LLRTNALVRIPYRIRDGRLVFFGAEAWRKMD